MARDPPETENRTSNGPAAVTSARPDPPTQPMRREGVRAFDPAPSVATVVAKLRRGNVEFGAKRLPFRIGLTGCPDFAIFGFYTVSVRTSSRRRWRRLDLLGRLLPWVRVQLGAHATGSQDIGQVGRRAYRRAQVRKTAAKANR